MILPVLDEVIEYQDEGKATVLEHMKAGKRISVVMDGLIDAFMPIFPVKFSTYVDS